MKVRPLVIHTFLPLVLGTTIYLLWRSSSLLVFHWLSAVGLYDFISFLRTLAKPAAASIPAWFLFSLPDGLWAYSLSAAVLLTWRSHLSRWWILWFTVAASLGVVSEIGQYLGIVPGTFEAADLLCYGVGSTVPLLLLMKGRLHEISPRHFGHDLGLLRASGRW